MPEGFFRELRQKLSATVDGAWVGKLDEKKGLGKAARDTGFAACIEGHMEAGTAGREAYRKCQQDTDLAGAYRRIWGTA